MHYSELEPDPELKPWIAAYWHFWVRPGEGTIDHSVPLTGGPMLAFVPRVGVIVCGPRTLPFHTQVQGGDVLWGVHFWPGSAVSLIGESMLGIREQNRPAFTFDDLEWLAKLAPQILHSACENEVVSQFNAIFLPRVAQAKPLDQLVMTAVFRLIASDGNLTIDELAKGLHISPRQLRRRFRTATELTPKEFSQLQRVRASASRAISPSPRSWVQIAADGGYSDQAHLVREFRRLLGMTPSAFGTHADRIDHGPLIR